MMTEHEVNVFVDGAKHYFRASCGADVDVGTPYLVDAGEFSAGDYTGIIGISGARKGCVLVSAPTAMIRHLLAVMGESSTDNRIMRDVIGEVANTISGNARKVFGPEFMISVPVVVDGNPHVSVLPRDLRAFVIPINWNNYSLSVVACLE